MAKRLSIKMLARLLRAQQEVLTTRQGRAERYRTLLRHLLPTIRGDVALAAQWREGGGARFLYEPKPLDKRLRSTLQSAVQAVMRARSPLGNAHTRSLLAMLHGAARHREAHSLHQAGISDAIVSVAPSGQGGSLVCAARNSHRSSTFLRFERIVLHLLHSNCAAVLTERGDKPGVEGLTPRASEITALLLKGHSERRIAELLGVSRSTVHTYVIAIYRRHRVHSRAELAYRLLGP